MSSYRVKRVLIIDDDEINNFICIKNMKDSGFAEHASYCLHGQDGLEELRSALEERPEDLPDVIFLDIRMPQVDGWAFLEQYKALSNRFPKHIYLFILSSSVYRRDIERAGNYPQITDYIIKPLNRDNLRQIQDRYFSA
ncbi:MAG: response regulator [Bacteroidia bacterium]